MVTKNAENTKEYRKTEANGDLSGIEPLKFKVIFPGGSSQPGNRVERETFGE